MKSFRKGYIDGNPKQVAKKILNVANKYKTNEIILIKDRIYSYLIIKNFIIQIINMIYYIKLYIR